MLGWRGNRYKTEKRRHGWSHSFPWPIYRLPDFSFSGKSFFPWSIFCFLYTVANLVLVLSCGNSIQLSLSSSLRMWLESDWLFLLVSHWFREAAMKRLACFYTEEKWSKRQSDSCKGKRQDSVNMVSSSKSKLSHTESSGAEQLTLRSLWALVSTKWLRERVSFPDTEIGIYYKYLKDEIGWD